MGQIGVLRSMGNGMLGFWCPGCAEVHVVNVDFDKRPAWEFNGDCDAPTFRPSILVRGVRRITDEEHARIMAGEKLNIPERVCHSFVEDGQIRYLSDCTHEYAGRTVQLTPPRKGEGHG